MDALTTVADAILNEKYGDIILTPEKNERPVLDNITNKNVVFGSPTSMQSSLSSLFSGKINSISKEIFKTPSKRRKNSLKYGDENKAPTPKTPKAAINHQKQSGSPVTPLSNLKMLTRIASMEEPILDRDPSSNVVKMRRCISEISNTASNVRNETTLPKFKRHPTCSDLGVELLPSSDGAVESSQLEVSRRDKSLGVLCERFLDHFPMEVSCLETPRRLIIDDVAYLLGTERRRVYDIINILECLNLAARVQKNMYQWMGKQHLEATLSRLKGLGQEIGLTFPLNKMTMQQAREKLFSAPGCCIGEKPELRKEKSIGIICQKFLMLFLSSSYPHVIQMDKAVALLLGQDGDDFEKLRCRGRRIYDIANVLISLKLIQRLPRCKAYIYTGPKVEAVVADEVSNSMKFKLRHSLLPPPSLAVAPSKNHFLVDDAVTPVDPDERKRVSVEAGPACRAKRNCLVGRTKSEEVRLQNQGIRQGVKRHPSLKDICEVAELERDKLKEEEQRVSGTKPAQNAMNKIIPEAIKWRLGKSFKFPFITSPKVALNFQNSQRQQPIAFTSDPPTTKGPGLTKVLVRPPFVVRRMSSGGSPSPSPLVNVATNPIYLVQNAFTDKEASTGSATNQGFRIYNQKHAQLRTLSLPDLSSEQIIPPGRVKPTSIEVSNNSTSTAKAIKSFCKSRSQMNIPNINLSTISRSHYKTTYGNSSQMANANNDPNQDTFHFVINSTSGQQPSNSSLSAKSHDGNPLPSPTFIKMFQTSPDNSSNDSELESIFGDSFKFVRPKSLVTKLESR